MYSRVKTGDKVVESLPVGIASRQGAHAEIRYFSMSMTNRLYWLVSVCREFFSSDLNGRSGLLRLAAENSPSASAIFIATSSGRCLFLLSAGLESLLFGGTSMYAPSIGSRTDLNDADSRSSTSDLLEPIVPTLAKLGAGKISLSRFSESLGTSYIFLISSRPRLCRILMTNAVCSTQSYWNLLYVRTSPIKFYFTPSKSTSGSSSPRR